MPLRPLTILTILMMLGACPAVSPVQAQETEAEIKRWSIKASLAIGPSHFNARGLSGYFEENGFDDGYDFFLGDIEYPRIEDENNLSWTLQATGRIRSRLDAGFIFHRAADTEVAGYSDVAGGATLRQRLWAVAPIVVWRPWAGTAAVSARSWWTEVAVGLGPSYVQGQTKAYRGRSASDRRLSPAEPEFTRIGAVVSLAYSETIGPFRLGGEGWYLYVGKQEIGPFEGEGLRLNERSVRFDQLTVGLFAALEF